MINQRLLAANMTIIFQLLQFFSNCSLNQTFLVRKLRIFNFARTLQFEKFKDAKNMTILFQTYSLKYSKKAFLVRKLLFLFCTIFCISAKFRVLIPNITIVFPNPQSKNTQEDNFGLKFENCFFYTKLFKTFNPKLHK